MSKIRTLGDWFMPHKIKTLEAYFQKVWVEGDLNALDAILAPGARSRGIMGDIPFDSEELKELVPMLRELLGPITVTMPKVIEQDDWLSALIEIKRVAAHNYAPVHVFNTVIARFDDARMIEIYSNLDTMSLFEQLGLLPDNALPVMLGGTRLK